MVGLPFAQDDPTHDSREHRRRRRCNGGCLGRRRQLQAHRHEQDEWRPPEQAEEKPFPPGSSRQAGSPPQNCWREDEGTYAKP